jgi:hypothetical protein
MEAAVLSDEPSMSEALSEARAARQPPKQKWGVREFVRHCRSTAKCQERVTADFKLTTLEIMMSEHFLFDSTLPPAPGAQRRQPPSIPE